MAEHRSPAEANGIACSGVSAAVIWHGLCDSATSTARYGAAVPCAPGGAAPVVNLGDTRTTDDDLSRLNGLKGTARVTLADGRVIECELLVSIDVGQTTLRDVRYVSTLEATADEGETTWYGYTAAFEQRLPEEAAPQVKDGPISPKTDWASLLGDNDLTGWFVEGGDPQAWQVERGELRVDTAKGDRRYNFLLTEKTYSEFLLRFEYQLSKGAATGVAFWASRDEKLHREGPVHPMVKLLDDPSYPNIGWPTGTLFWNQDGGGHLQRPNRTAKLEPAGSWNQVEIEARAQSLRVSVNGALVLNARPDKLADEAGAFAGLKRCSGHVGFEKGNAGVARFRKIEIKELKPAARVQDDPAKDEPATTKGYLGLAIRATLHGEPYVDAISVGSPADKAGLKRADTLLGINGTPIHDIKALRAQLEKVRPGDKVNLRILRPDSPKNQELSIQIDAGAPPSSR
jgi:hypothetical protein